MGLFKSLTMRWGAGYPVFYMVNSVWFFDSDNCSVILGRHLIVLAKIPSYR